MVRAVKKTKYIKYRTFKNDANAKAYLALLQKEFPDRVFSIKKVTYPGKLKLRFTVRSLLK